MKNLLLLTFICLTANVLSAQFGISSKYQSNTFKNWEAPYASDLATIDPVDFQLMENSIEFGVNYWFRLKNKRIEFLPEVTYGNVTETLIATSTDDSYVPTSLVTIGINSNIQIYPLDFAGDCNCPTFGKDGSILKKGFYWLINPGIAFHDLTLSTASDDFNVKSTSFRMGLGAGLDIGIHKYITLSPFIMYDKDFRIASEVISLVGNFDYPNASRNTWNFGLRILFRPDYAKQNRGLYR